MALIRRLLGCCDGPKTRNEWLAKAEGLVRTHPRIVVEKSCSHEIFVMDVANALSKGKFTIDLLNRDGSYKFHFEVVAWAVMTGALPVIKAMGDSFNGFQLGLYPTDNLVPSSWGEFGDWASLYDKPLSDYMLDNNIFNVVVARAAVKNDIDPQLAVIL